MSDTPDKFGNDAEFGAQMADRLGKWLEEQPYTNYPVTKPQYDKIRALLGKYRKNPNPKPVGTPNLTTVDTVEQRVLRTMTAYIKAMGRPIRRTEAIEHIGGKCKCSPNTFLSTLSNLSKGSLVRVWKEGDYASENHRHKVMSYWLPNKELPEGFVPYHRYREAADAIREPMKCGRPEVMPRVSGGRGKPYEEYLQLEAKAEEREALADQYHAEARMFRAQAKKRLSRICLGG